MAFVVRTPLIIAIFVATLLSTGSAHCASSDPFGGHHTFEVVYSSLFEKWSSTIAKLSRDHAQLRACTDGNVTECLAALHVTYASNLDHGRGILCPNAKGYSSGAGMCADWRHHH